MICDRVPQGTHKLSPGLAVSVLETQKLIGSDRASKSREGPTSLAQDGILGNLIQVY